jgi:hypothetical protein
VNTARWLAVLVGALGGALVSAPAQEPAAAPAGPSVYEADGPAQPRGRIDELLFARLRELGIPPARPCADAVFLRRAFVDVIGTLPTADEARRFLDDPSPAKRDELIDELLARPEFALYQANRWGDVLRIKAEFPVNLWPNGAQAYSRWVHSAMARNLTYDDFVRQLLVATGSNFRVPEVNFWRSAADRSPAGLGRAVALLCLGERSEKWPVAAQQGFGAFFARMAWKPTQEWKEEIVYVDFAKPAPPQGTLPDGSIVALAPDADPRAAVADWLLRGRRPPAAPVVCNRIWYWLFGRGLGPPPHAIRADNPPSHPDVLQYLADELVAAHWDLKHVYRLILRSSAWQLAPVPASADPRALATFAHYPLKRLDAEVLIDALCQLTGTSESYQSAIPEPFTFVPEGTRAIALGDGSISSAVLELFGRPARDTGLAAERSDVLSPAQRLHLLNSSHVQKKLEGSRLLQGLARRGGDPARAVEDLYLAILSRRPTDDERAAVRRAFANQRGAGPQNAQDLAWALVNSTEFLHRH